MDGLTKAQVEGRDGAGPRKLQRAPVESFPKGASAHQLKVGACCYLVQEDDDGMPAVYQAVYLGRKRAACCFRHPITGEQWQETGMHWFARRQQALRAYIDAQISMLNAPVSWLRISRCSRADLFRRLVRACAALDSLGKQTT